MRRRRPKLFLKGRSTRARQRLLAVFLLLFAPALPRPTRADCVPFDEPPSISETAMGAVAVAVADVDGDGDLDALSVSTFDDKVAWYENGGDGASWTVRTIWTAADLVSALEVADVDGDGDTDALSGSSGDSTLAWYENDGTGTIWTLRTIALDFNANAFTTGDLDRDGDPDVLLKHLVSSLLWRSNDGAGGGWIVHTVSTSFDTISSVEVADLDADGDLDALVTLNTAGAVVWYANDGAGGSWALRTITTSADIPVASATGDLDADGDLDVLSASVVDDMIAWYQNDGTATIWLLRTISTTADNARSVAVGDIDGDGDLDVYSASLDDDKIAWYENDGDGVGWTLHTLSTAANGAFAVTGADLDGDGDLDALSASSVDNTVAWYRNDRLHGAPLLAPPVELTGELDAPKQLDVADLDRDGDLDLVTASQLDNTIGWVQNFGGVWFHRTISTTAMGALSATPGDVDGDGDLDVLSASRDDDAIAWYENDGTPGNDLSWSKRTITVLANVARQVVAADLDGDGHLDAVSASRNDDTVAWYENDGTPLNGGWTLRTISDATNGAFSVAVADIDGNGDLDVVSASFYDGVVQWHKNDGSPTNGGWMTIPISLDTLGPRFVVARDIDRDGDVDVVSASESDDSIVIHENFDGIGILWLHQTISATADGVYSVRAADVDGDGDLDLASANYNEDTVAWYENDGAGGGWTEHAISTVPNGATSVVVADFDGDGTPDLAFSSAHDASVRLALNPGTLVFGEGQETNEATACWSDAVP